ncbi:transcriptional regulator [Kribbella turkmenica]|uniref:Transcriptional regulator n=1 Tax=Kribbella turkmenica TaxID=2530375 RepID=A0A4V2YGY8_9ACTN|nr:helix-turn-helix transcriptional regulator [Kribbella turkmenica]TDD28947.1 transcriptional regulator [Kribbella turkmenica]
MEDVEAFAAALQRVRRRAGLTYRELADHAHYSHAHLVRATGGKHLPSWDVTAAFLTGCGVPADLMPAWRRRWESVNREDVAELLRTADTLEELGAALSALARPRSLRTLQQLSGVPRATIQAWLSGSRRASRDRLDRLIRALGATPQERAAFSRAFDRISAGRCRVGRAA